MTQLDRARRFRRLHESDAGTLVLPNAWDAMSARVIERAGAAAIATTSAGVSWSLGRRDGGGLAREEMLDAVRRIASVVEVPVSADVEGGYGAGSVDDVAETVRGVVACGAVGVNLEDGVGRSARALMDADAQGERIAAARDAARAAGADLFVNARIDTFLRQVGEPGERFSETVRRAERYVAAGADGIFVPGVVDAATIGRLAAAIAAPLNVMAGPGAPTVAELRELGVARVSVGPAITMAVMAHVRDAAVEIIARGTYRALDHHLDFAEADGMFPGRG
jgi:2-methylisocitrate lyase-like PEP mutase family enzyme